MKDRPHAVNPNEYAVIKTWWVVFYVKNDKVTYCNSFGVEHFPKKIKKPIGNKAVKANIFRIQAYD